MGLIRQGGGVLAARLGQALANIIAGWLLARILGPAGQGRYSLLLLVIFFGAALLNGGLGLAAVPMLRRGTVAARRMLKAQALWVAVMSVFAVGIGLLFYCCGFADRIGLRDLSLILKASVVLGMTGLMAFEIQLYDLLALGRLHSGPVVNAVRAVLHLGLLLCLALFDVLSLGAALVVYALSQAGAAVGVFLLILKTIPGQEPPISGHRYLPDLVGHLFSKGWVGQLSSLASILHLRLDLMIVAWFHGPAAVGLYTVAVLAGETLWHLPNALQPLLVYSASGQEDGPARDWTTLRAVRIGLLATVVGALVWAVVARPVFSVFLQDEYLAAIPALMALLPGIVVFSCGSVLAGDFIGRGHPGWNTQASLLTVLVNIACGFLLIPRFSIVGAAWASSIAYLAGSVMMFWRFSRISNCPVSRIFRLKP